MNKILVAFITVIIGFGSQLALAKKPDEAGGKSGMKEHKSAMKEMHKNDRDDEKTVKDKMKKDKIRDHDDDDDDDDEKKVKDKAKREKLRDHEDDDEASGLARQREKKAEQERKELGKGSEQGQASREEHSRKWWNFWE